MTFLIPIMKPNDNLPKTETECFFLTQKCGLFLWDSWLFVPLWVLLGLRVEEPCPLRPPGYISDKEEAKEALGVAPEMPGKVLTTVQPVEVEPEPVKAPKPLPDLFESEGMKFSDPENVMTLPGAKFDVARDPETKPEYGSTQESVAPPPPNPDYGDQQQAAPLPPIPASPDYTDSQVPVILTTSRSQAKKPLAPLTTTKSSAVPNSTLRSTANLIQTRINPANKASQAGKRTLPAVATF
ncbi:hypothetical protein L596_030052 [Steinernema carpocapsae]|uniref:Uncharacterized protein n=1 Tax=Steinernema carpocapsae TaxID=34508 RepID=A0A4U5LRL0_STECR|nr:hypothetical protein L596_030052 [Steinernema carpocapsae]